MVHLLLRGDDLPLVHGVRVRVHGVRVRVHGVHGVRVHVVGNVILRWGWIHGVRVLWGGGSLF